jgi:hypothetical protein
MQLDIALAVTQISCKKNEVNEIIQISKIKNNLIQIT